MKTKEEAIKKFREEFGTTAKDRIVEINVNFVEQFISDLLAEQKEEFEEIVKWGTLAKDPIKEILNKL